MKVTRDKTEESQAFLTVEVEPAEVETAMEQSYRELAKKKSIPGFRKGKVPRAVLERYVGRESLFEEALHHMVPDAYEKAIKEQDIQPFAQPQIEIAQTDPVVFKATVPLPPTVELGDYRSLKVEPEPVQPTDGNVDAVMEELRHRYATWEPVGRPAATGDLVMMDIDSHIGDEPYINRQGIQYQLDKDSTAPLPGFAGQLTGMSKGEEKEFALKFPDDHPQQELAGKEANFKVKLSEVKEEKLPELNDELAKQVSPGFETLEALRQQTAVNMKQGEEERARAAFEDRVISAAVEQAKLEFPPVLVEMEIDQMLNEQARRLQMSGSALEDYLKSINKTEAEMREELRPVARRRISASLVLGKVSEAEKVEVAGAEIDAEIDKMTANSQRKDELLKLFNTPRSRESIRQSLLTRKTIERLADIAGSQTSQKTEGEEKQNE